MSDESTRNITQPQYSLPPANGRTNGKGQCHPGALSLGIPQLSTGRLRKTTTNCRILLQQHTNRNHCTKITSFFTNYGYHPRFLPDLGTRNDETPEVSEYVEALSELHEDLRAEIKDAQMAQTEQAVTLGLSRNRSVGRIKGNQATFNNSQWNNLRSCVWV